MGQHGTTDDLAGRLRRLKDRRGRSYEALAARLDVSRSALHRYCSGQSIPPLALVEQFAAECQADADELAGLRRTWLLAQAPAGSGASEPVAALEPGPVLTEERPDPLPPPESTSSSRSRDGHGRSYGWPVVAATAVAAVVVLVVWFLPLDQDGEAAASGGGSCQKRTPVSHEDRRQEEVDGRKHIWTTDYLCPNHNSVPLFKYPGSAEKIGQMETVKSWFVCWTVDQNSANEADSVWYYTLGDQKEPGADKQHGWGFMPARDVPIQKHPWPGMPLCHL